LISIEVTGPSDLPVRVRHYGDQPAPGDTRPVHQPQYKLPRRAVMPENIRLAIAIEVITFRACVARGLCDWWRRLARARVLELAVNAVGRFDVETSLVCQPY